MEKRWSVVGMWLDTFAIIGLLTHPAAARAISPNAPVGVEIPLLPSLEQDLSDRAISSEKTGADEGSLPQHLLPTAVPSATDPLIEDRPRDLPNIDSLGLERVSLNAADLRSDEFPIESIIGQSDPSPETPATPATPTAPSETPATPATPTAPSETPATPATPTAPSETPTTPATPATPAAPPPPTPDPQQKFLLNKIEVRGSTILTSEEIAELTQPLEGTEVSFDDLQTLADKITQIYLERDFISSRAIVPQQQVVDGAVVIEVIEGRLAEIRVEGNRHINTSYITSRIELGAGTPLNTYRLEDQLRLLRSNPLFESVEASLRAGEGTGESILIVRVTEARRFGFSASADNYSPPSVGSERLVFNARYRNLTGLGDELSAGYNRTTAGGTNVFDFSYRVPVNAMNGTLQLRYAPNNNELVQEPIDRLGIKGERELYEVSFRQPLVRSLREEFALSLGFTYQSGQTFVFESLPTPFGLGPDEDGKSKTSVVQFGQDYLRRDSQGTWAFRSMFNFGTGLFDATNNPDDAPVESLNAVSDPETIPDGQFVSWLGQVQRAQRLGDNQLLIFQFDIQLTPDPLLPAQQFVIGGGLSLRGYRQNARSGDNGFRFSVEDRITLARDAAGQPEFQLAPFLDVGSTWNDPENPSTQSDQRFLAGLGLGIIWQPEPRIRIRLDYGLPLIRLNESGDNAQDDGFYFSAGYEL
jgi:hemolysin activation/secretion protein